MRNVTNEEMVITTLFDKGLHETATGANLGFGFHTHMALFCFGCSGFALYSNRGTGMLILHSTWPTQAPREEVWVAHDLVRKYSVVSYRAARFIKHHIFAEVLCV